METRWKRFLSRMEEHRTMLEASIEFHQLYEQVQYYLIYTSDFCSGYGDFRNKAICEETKTTYDIKIV